MRALVTLISELLRAPLTLNSSIRKTDRFELPSEDRELQALVTLVSF